MNFTEQDAKDYVQRRLLEMCTTHSKVQAVNQIIQELYSNRFIVTIARYPVKGVSMDAQGVIYHV